jgi:hypothetical protein
VAGCTTNFAARMLASAAKVESPYRGAILRQFRDWALPEHLAGHHVRVMDVSVREENPTYAVVSGHWTIRRSPTIPTA